MAVLKRNIAERLCQITDAIHACAVRRVRAEPLRKALAWHRALNDSH